MDRSSNSPSRIRASQGISRGASPSRTQASRQMFLRTADLASMGSSTADTSSLRRAVSVRSSKGSSMDASDAGRFANSLEQSMRFARRASHDVQHNAIQLDGLAARSKRISADGDAYAVGAFTVPSLDRRASYNGGTRGAPESPRVRPSLAQLTTAGSLMPSRLVGDLVPNRRHTLNGELPKLMLARTSSNNGLDKPLAPLSPLSTPAVYQEDTDRVSPLGMASRRAASIALRSQSIAYHAAYTNSIPETSGQDAEEAWGLVAQGATGSGEWPGPEPLSPSPPCGSPGPRSHPRSDVLRQQLRSLVGF